MNNQVDASESNQNSSAAIKCESVPCDLCGCRESKLLYTIKSKFNGIWLPIVRCIECSHVYVNPRVSSVHAKDIYSDDYYAGVGIDGNFKGDSPEKTKDADLLVAAIEKTLNKKQLRVLDLGGGAGLVSIAAKRRGHIPVLIDPSSAAVKLAVARGLDAYATTPEQFAKENPVPFDVVVALEVIEHVYSPKQFLEAVGSLLAKRGLLVFTTGNVEAIRFEGSRWGYFQIPEAHLHFFSRKIMARYLERAGFSQSVDVYKLVYKRWWAIKIIEKMGLRSAASREPELKLHERLICNIARYIEILAGRARHNWAIKN
jgi:2-polyprenyl-3-methyl-5-hydroxy-6-metoxy-1,4-benzoquinol methylase